MFRPIFSLSAMLFSGKTNSISMTREYYQEYACKFDLYYYPFDTQVKSIFVIFNLHLVLHWLFPYDVYAEVCLKTFTRATFISVLPNMHISQQK